jgi:hypothetical protein
LKAFIVQHMATTKSERATQLLSDWDTTRTHFRRVIPHEYKAVLEKAGQSTPVEEPHGHYHHSLFGLSSIVFSIHSSLFDHCTCTHYLFGLSIWLSCVSYSSSIHPLFILCSSSAHPLLILCSSSIPPVFLLHRSSKFIHVCSDSCPLRRPPPSQEERSTNQVRQPHLLHQQYSSCS